ncbi:MAG: ABC transporter permease [SAR202 cluster bacterium]|nr:ABC transporter permease [SAR202 cluster bacterium]
MTPKGINVAKVFGTLRRWPIIPVAVVLFLMIIAIFAPLVAPHHPLEAKFEKRNVPPVWTEEGTSEYLMGGDHIGRDILSRIIFGTRISLMVAATVLAAGAFVGTALGVTAGYFGGIVDEILMRLVDFTYAVPFILVALVAAVIWEPSLQLVIILLAIFTWPPFARQVRVETLQLKAMDYVAMARVSGASSLRIAFKHILPGIVPTVMVMASLQVGALVITESVLSFLGVGIPAPDPSWGSMVAQGRNYVATAWWIAFFPGVAIFLIVFSMNFLGDWLRDTLDPKLRQL